MHPESSIPRSLTLHWQGRTDQGRYRPNNEDAFLGLRFDAREVQHLGKIGDCSTQFHDFVFAVSDGMGGAKSGEYASRIAVEKLTLLLPKSFQQSAAGLQTGFADVLTEVYDQVHRALVYLGRCYDECAGMEATLSLCWFTPQWMFFGHIGDSRIYHFPASDRSMKQLTQDDTYVGWLYRTGQINEREARTHPRRSVLQKSLGGGNQFVDPQVGAVAYEPGDMFLLCSDGLVDGLYDQHLLEIVRPEQPYAADFNLASHLVDAALDHGSRDNTTVLLVRCD